MSVVKKQLRDLPAAPGVYMFRDLNARVLYVGKSTNIASRVKSHITASNPKTVRMVALAQDINFISVTCELEALLLEAKLIKKHLPPYNSTAKDDKHPLYIKITREEFPKVTTSRKGLSPTSPRLRGAQYFGPFPSSLIVRQVLKQIRKVFPYCSQKGTAKRGCFYSHIGLCGPCPGEISRIKNHELRIENKKLYKRNIRRILLLLSGKTKMLRTRLAADMRRLAGHEKFEEAAKIRDSIFRLEYITRPYNKAEAYLENPNLLDDIREGETQALFQVLKENIPNFKSPHRIEAFDVAHIGGTSATCSLVTFVDGEPEKNLYRRFKIRRAKTTDDFAMLYEAVSRRLLHLNDWGKPDLILIDGGKGQVSSAISALEKARVKIPVIGLAKRHEEIIISVSGDVLGYRFAVLKLGTKNPGVQLLQRLRDEAHRFARSYHFKLRMKELV